MPRRFKLRPAANAKSIASHREDTEANRRTGDGDPAPTAASHMESACECDEFSPKAVACRSFSYRFLRDLEEIVIEHRAHRHRDTRDFLPQCSNAFARPMRSTTRRHGGLGLGLAIVRHLTEMHGGEVSCGQSEATGQGATFTIQFTAGNCPSTRRSHRAHARRTSSRRRSGNTDRLSAGRSRRHPRPSRR